MPENWQTYFAHIDDLPATILVNLGAAEVEPKPPHLTWLRISYEVNREDGFPDEAQREALDEIEEALDAAMEELGFVVHFVGRLTHQGLRAFYFYSDNPLGVESALGGAMVPFGSDPHEIGQRDEEDWETYFGLLYPSPRDMQLISNQQLLGVLAEHGDDHELPREVEHFAYFPTEVAGHEFAGRAAAEGFTLGEHRPPEEPGAEWGVRVTRVDPVDYFSIGDATLLLFELAEECGGSYDGWETVIMKAGENGAGERSAEQ